MGSTPIAVISPIGQVVANLNELHRIGEKFLKRPISQAVDEAGLRPNSDFAYLIMIGNLEEYRSVAEVVDNVHRYSKHLFYSFFFIMSEGLVKDLALDTNLNILAFPHSELDGYDSGIISGTLSQWIDSIECYLTDHGAEIRHYKFACGFYELFVTLGFGKLFENYEKVPKKDYFILRKV